MSSLYLYARWQGDGVKVLLLLVGWLRVVQGGLLQKKALMIVFLYFSVKIVFFFFMVFATTYYLVIFKDADSPIPKSIIICHLLQ